MYIILQTTNVRIINDVFIVNINEIKCCIISISIELNPNSFTDMITNPVKYINENKCL